MPDVQGIQKKKVAVLGASGYTGAELIRLLMRHSGVELVALTGDRQAGNPAEQVYPHLRDLDLPALQTMDSVNWSVVDVAFCCLPHGASQSIIPTIPEHVVIIDLSADFRLKDASTYAQWYGEEHAAPAMLENAVYGLSEIYRDAISAARLIACPGCYPTSVQLPLIPLLKEDQITADLLIIDAKSGVTGAGRSLKQNILFSEVNEGIGAYGIANHRHTPEIEQGLTAAASRHVAVTFTPHLVPMNRGILSTIYVGMDVGVTCDEIRDTLREAYRDAPFVTVCEVGSAIPTTHQVRGTNRCMIAVYPDRHTGRIIIVSVIDNLLKGASGQAVQNFNIRFGFDETTALDRIAIFP